jgi:capsular exopolysaccharide synthesis family protein
MNRVAAALKRVHQWHSPQPAGAAPYGRGPVHQGGAPAAAEAERAAPAGDGAGGRHSPSSRTRPVLVAGDPRYGRASDEFQVLSALLQSLAAEQDKHLFAVTSALAGEGKSFVALNLAASLARGGARVLLVDADLNKPSLHDALRLDGRGGILDCLTGKTAFETSIRATGLPGLSLVPAGGAAAGAAPELFTHPRMREFIAAAKAAYVRDYVVIDCAPALTRVEAQIVARLADALVMVVAANRTPRHSVARALNRLAGCAVAGLVLNRFDPSYSCRAEYPVAPSSA